MALGPGKYDEICTIVRRGTEAAGAAVIILKGEKGSGFSFQGPIDKETLVHFAGLLRLMADEIEESAKRGAKTN